MKPLWGFLVSLLLLKELVNGFELVHLNGTQMVLQQLDSTYGAYSSRTDPVMVGLTLIKSAGAKGAVCLDGSLPGYHLHRGFGSGENRWLIQLEGGGWCNNVRTCVYRKTSPHASSMYMEKEIQFTGILSANAEENPDFFNWNRVKLRYCDGASFTGDSQDKFNLIVGGATGVPGIEDMVSCSGRFDVEWNVQSEAGSSVGLLCRGSCGDTTL